MIVAQNSVFQENKVEACGADGEGRGGGLVERALPPGGEVVEGIAQVGGGKVVRTEGKDGDLLAGVAVEGGRVGAGYEKAVVGVHPDVEPLAVVVHEQTDVAQRVVLALARRAEYGYTPLALSGKVVDGFRQVVALLLGDAVQQVAVTQPVLFGEGVAVADDDVGHTPVRDVGIGRPVATGHVGGCLQYFQRQGGCGVVAIGEDDGFKGFFHKGRWFSYIRFHFI